MEPHKISDEFMSKMPTKSPISHVIPISGKDSLATALVQKVNNPTVPYTYVFNDVGSELPETYEWLNLIELKTNWKILKIGCDLQNMIKKNKVLPSRRMRYCTTKAKILPFEKFFAGKSITVYYGLRADEPDRKGYVPHNNIKPVYPLREMGITLPMVLSICKSQGLKPPTFFWQRLYARVSEEMASRCPLFDWRDCLSEIEFDLLFAGRSRSNCYFCFFQRLYEWVWLSEVHPDLFENALKMEQDCGSSNYTWRQDYSLTEVRDRADATIAKRTKQVCNYIEKRMSSKLFGGIEVDDLSLTSCGLLCGK